MSIFNSGINYYWNPALSHWNKSNSSGLLFLSLPPFPRSPSPVSEANIKKSHGKGSFCLTAWATKVETLWGSAEPRVSQVSRKHSALHGGHSSERADRVRHECQHQGCCVSWGLGRMPWNCQIMGLGATLPTLLPPSVQSPVPRKYWLAAPRDTDN